ncbi:MAG: FG-GAP-like repeat-containing protein [Gemmataceae bacterium]|nr:FG-GAP-like repeat-containing protein [Gemmataceae bacterium]
MPRTTRYRPARPALGCLRLEDRTVPAAHLFAVGPDGGGPAEVRVYDPAGGLRFTIPAYEAAFTGGVRVATGDVTGDGTDDIVTVPGPGGGPRVRVFDGKTGSEVRSFFADASTARVGLTVAVGDVTGDGRADVVTGTGVGGGPRVTAHDGATGAVLRDFFAYDSTFRGGVNVAAGDLTGDGRAEIVTAPARGSPHVKAFDGSTAAEARSFFAYDPAATGGVSLAAADVTADGRADIVTAAGVGAGPHVKVFDGQTGTVARSFFAYGAGFQAGVNVAAADLDGDGAAEVITAPGPGGEPRVKRFDGQTGAEVGSFLAFGGPFVDGVTTGSGLYVPPPPAPPPPPALPPFAGFPDLSGFASSIINAAYFGGFGGFFI